MSDRRGGLKEAGSLGRAGRHRRKAKEELSLVYLPARPKSTPKRDRIFDTREKKGSHMEDLSNVDAMLELEMDLNAVDEDDFEHYDAYQSSRFYTYGTHIPVEEDREHEFKSGVNSTEPGSSVNKHLAKYANAFLNTNGGTLYFGVEDDGRISGLEMPRGERDRIRLSIDGILSTFKPQVDSKLYNVSFVPLKNFTNVFVVEVEIAPGPEPVYFTGAGDAYIRRDGGCSKMEWTAIKQRLKSERNRDEAVVCAWTLTLPEDFIGREAEIQKIRAFVCTNPTSQSAVLVIGIYGQPCVGKSSFSHRLAYEFSSMYKDGAFHIDLSDKNNGYLSQREAMVSIIRVRHPDKIVSWNMADVRAVYNSCFDSQHTLLLIENAGSQEMIEPLLPHPGRGRCLVLITSRKNLALDLVSENSGRLLAYSVRLDPLNSDDGMSLLNRYFDTRTAPATAQALLEQSGGLPIVIRWIGTTLKKRPNLTPEKLLARLENEDDRLQPVEAQFNVYFALIPQNLSKVLCAISVFSSSFELSAAAFVLQKDPDDTLDELGELLEESLLYYDIITQRYSQNDMVRLYAAKKMKNDPGLLNEYRKRFVEYYYSLLRLAQRLHTAGQRVQEVEKVLAMPVVEMPPAVRPSSTPVNLGSLAALREPVLDADPAREETAQVPRTPVSLSPNSFSFEQLAGRLKGSSGSPPWAGSSDGPGPKPRKQSNRSEGECTDESVVSATTSDDEDVPHMPRVASVYAIVDQTTRESITTHSESRASALLYKLERRNFLSALHLASRMKMQLTAWRMCTWTLMFERRDALRIRDTPKLHAAQSSSGSGNSTPALALGSPASPAPPGSGKGPDPLMFRPQSALSAAASASEGHPARPTTASTEKQ